MNTGSSDITFYGPVQPSGSFPQPAGQRRASHGASHTGAPAVREDTASISDAARALAQTAAAGGGRESAELHLSPDELQRMVTGDSGS